MTAFAKITIVYSPLQIYRYRTTRSHVISEIVDAKTLVIMGLIYINFKKLQQILHKFMTNFTKIYGKFYKHLWKFLQKFMENLRKV